MRFALLLALAFVAGFAFFRGSKSTPEQNFWTWFKDNENDVFDFEKNRERTFDRLAAEMHKVNPSLTFEFGPKENGHREFVISADGIKEAFPAVESLYAAAPTLPRWKFIKFRPRRKPFDVSYAGVSVKARSVKVRVDPQGQTADITVFIPGYTAAERQAYTGIAFLFLDQALGEHDVETRVGKISVEAAPEAGNTYSLESLPAVFDSLLVKN